ncbi:MAG: caspase family protein [Elusimicrobia bacterium]|nr:caspase family protein [Elusimicrobiota bacterium]
MNLNHRSRVDETVRGAHRAMISILLVHIAASSAYAGEPWKLKTPMTVRRADPGVAVVSYHVYVIGGRDGEAVDTVESYDTSVDAWRNEPRMPTARSGAAVGVIDGLIYVAGGADTKYRRLGTLEVLDPSTDRWSTRAPMPTPREAQGAVVDGILYVIGGRIDGGTCTGPVEAYNPKTNKWTKKASLPSTSICNVSVAAIDGLIYVIGNTDDKSNPVSFMVVYDPSTDRWSSKTPAPTKQQHPALAVSGHLLYSIGGGSEYYGFQSSVEVYDPKTDVWNVRTPMPRPRGRAVAAVTSGGLFIFGGVDASGMTASVEEYNQFGDSVSEPWESPWRRVAPIPIPRVDATGGAIDGKFCVYGGKTSYGYDIENAHCYDPKTNAWISMARSVGPMVGGRSVAYNGKLYVLGGSYRDGQGKFPGHSLGHVFVYDVTSHGSGLVPPSMPTQRFGTAVAVLENHLYAVGGIVESHDAFPWHAVRTVEAYDLSAGKWEEKASIPIPLNYAGAAVAKGKLYVVGGWTDPLQHCSTAVFSYDPATNQWSPKRPMPISSCSAPVAEVDGILYAFGKDYVEAYDPVSDRWTSKTPMPIPREGMAVGVIDGIVYLAGGRTNSIVDTTESYDPKKDKTADEIIAMHRPASSTEPPRRSESDVDVLPSRVKAAHPHDFALIVGIERYRSVPQADFAEHDAETFKRYAESVLGVPGDNIIALSGQRASRTDIAKYLEEWLPRNVNGDSRVYFYFSGHGAVDAAKGTPYLVPWDGDPDFLPTTAFSTPDIYRQLEALKAKEVIAMLDACFSGQGGRSVGVKGMRPLTNVIDPTFPKGSRLTVLTAVTGREIAGTLEAQEHGIFTYFLLKGLKGDADAKHDGHVGLGDLYDFVRKSVSTAAHRLNREQTPGLHTNEMDLKFY